MIIFISVFVSFNTFRKVEQAKEKNRMDFFHGLIHTYNEIIPSVPSCTTVFIDFFVVFLAKQTRKEKPKE